MIKCFSCGGSGWLWRVLHPKFSQHRANVGCHVCGMTGVVPVFKPVPEQVSWSPTALGAGQ